MKGYNLILFSALNVDLLIISSLPPKSHYFGLSVFISLFKMESILSVLNLLLIGTLP